MHYYVPPSFDRPAGVLERRNSGLSDILIYDCEGPPFAQTRSLQKRTQYVSSQPLSSPEQLQRLWVLRSNARSRSEPRVRLPGRGWRGAPVPHLPSAPGGRCRHALLPHVLQDLSDQPLEAVPQLSYGQEDGSFKGRPPLQSSCAKALGQAPRCLSQQRILRHGHASGAPWAAFEVVLSGIIRRVSSQVHWVWELRPSVQPRGTPLVLWVCTGQEQRWVHVGGPVSLSLSVCVCVCVCNCVFVLWDGVAFGADGNAVWYALCGI